MSHMLAAGAQGQAHANLVGALPSARVNTAVMVNPGLFDSMRKLNRKFWAILDNPTSHSFSTPPREQPKRAPRRQCRRAGHHSHCEPNCAASASGSAVPTP